MTNKQILDLPMTKNDARAKTVGEYFRNLLITLWVEGEGFSGKRPFGNSGWEYDIYKPLIKAGALKGELDGDGYVDKVDKEMAHKLVKRLLNSVVLTEKV